MITRERLKRIARIKGLSIGNAEKDYLIDLVLLSISRNTRDELVFKGGTCLYKFHKLDRFSEDIDFTRWRDINIDRITKKIISDLDVFGVNANIRKKKELQSSVLISLRAEGPLYDGNPHTYSSIGIDINLKSSIDMEPVNRVYTPIYDEIPSYSILTMREEEILMEKIRALMTRGKARDVYDVWFLLKGGLKIDKELLDRKLEYYNIKFSKEEFKRSIQEKEIVWERELKPLLASIPPFEQVIKDIISMA